MFEISSSLHILVVPLASLACLGRGCSMMPIATTHTPVDLRRRTPRPPAHLRAAHIGIDINNTRLREAQSNATFRVDPGARAIFLVSIRDLIRAAYVDFDRLDTLYPSLSAWSTANCFEQRLLRPSSTSSYKQSFRVVQDISTSGTRY